MLRYIYSVGPLLHRIVLASFFNIFVGGNPKIPILLDIIGRQKKDTLEHFKVLLNINYKTK